MFLNKKVVFFIEYTWLLVLLLLACLFYLSQQTISLFFNSDLLIIPSLFKDIFTNNNHYKDWFLSPAPHFFPDMVLYLPTIYLFKQIYLQFLVYICLILLLTYLIIKHTYRLFFTKNSATFFALTAVSTLFILAFALITPYMFFLAPATHYGEFLIGLFLIGITTKIISNKKFNFKNYVELSISVLLILACSTSDLLFIIQFVIPIFLSNFILYLKKYIQFRRFVLLAALCIGPAIIGGLFSKYLVPHQILFKYLAPSAQKISLHTIMVQVSAFINIIKTTIKYRPGYVFPIFYLYICFMVGIILLNKEKLKIFHFNEKIIFWTLTIFLSVFINAVVLCLFTHPGIITERYLIPLYFFPYIFFFIPICVMDKYRIKYIIIIFVLYVILIFSLINPLKILINNKINPKLEYYPEVINCIDKSLEYYDHGVAEYWDANLISILSKRKLEVLPLNRNLEPNFWEINSTKFSKPSRFVILSNINILFDLNPNIVNAKYGNPEKIVHCEDKILLIYKRNSIKTITKPYFAHSGDSLNWPAAILPSLIPNSNFKDKRIAKLTDIKNFLSYGPYISLPEGSYHFYIKYKSDGISSKQAVAYYDVYSNTLGVIVRKLMYESKNKNIEITGKFKVTKMQANKHFFEIRVFPLGKNNLVLEDITLVKN